MISIAMIDPDKQQLTLKIADEKIVTTIMRKDEFFLKKVEREVNTLWDRWKLMFPARSKTEVLAMMAFQYAKLYYGVVEDSERRESGLKEFIRDYEAKMDEILLDI